MGGARAGDVGGCEIATGFNRDGTPDESVQEQPCPSVSPRMIDAGVLLNSLKTK